MQPSTDTSFFGHPRGLRTLFFTEMWERFSYYGMRALLLLFMTAPIAAGGLGFAPSKAGPIYAMYTSLVYIMSLPGGWLADNLLGHRKSVLYGGIVIMVGHICLAVHGMSFFYAGLGFVVLGTGLLKPNISAIVGQLYSPEDRRRDAGFSIYYMGINIGALSAPLITGFLAQSETFKGMLEGFGIDPKNSWHWGFAAAAVGMFLGLVQYVLTGRNMGEAGLRPAPARSPEQARARKRTIWIGVGATAALAAGILLFDRTANYIDEVAWTAKPLYVLSGVPAGSEKELDYAGGDAISESELEGVIGAERMPLVHSALERGESTGEITGLPLSIGGLGKGQVLDTLHWRRLPAVAFALSGKAEGERRVRRLAEGRAVTAAELPAVLGEAQAATLLATFEAGALSGTLADARVDELAGVDWEAVAGVRFAVTSLPAAGAEAPEHVLGSSYDVHQLKGEIGEAKTAGMLLALQRGADAGRISDVRFKVGGVNSKSINLGYTVLILVIVVTLFSRLLFGGDWTPNERARLVSIFVLFLGAAVFWGVFEQAGSTLTLFADRSTRNSVFGFSFPSSWWQSVNAALIVLLAPVAAWFWVKLGDRNPSDTAKFSVGILCAGLGFLILIGGAIGAGSWNRVSPMWLFSVYLIHTIGELWLSPVGLSSMTKLAPERVVGLMMGVWFLAAAVGNFMGGTVAGFYEHLSLPTLLGLVAAGAIAMAIVMFLLVKPINRMLARSGATPRSGVH